MPTVYQPLLSPYVACDECGVMVFAITAIYVNTGTYCTEFCAHKQHPKFGGNIPEIEDS